jgi:hypothetical protein
MRSGLDADGVRTFHAVFETPTPVFERLRRLKKLRSQWPRPGLRSNPLANRS